jgi:hypothetical protein
MDSDFSFQTAIAGFTQAEFGDAIIYTQRSDFGAAHRNFK